MYGTFPRVIAGPLQALTNPSASIVGIGLTPEATETNYVVYELALDLVWKTVSDPKVHLRFRPFPFPR